MPDSELTIVLSVLEGSLVTKRHVFEAVGDIEVTDAVELSTEPGVMGRIGPMFPRTASFSVRLHDKDARTPLYETAREQHALLRSLIGQFLYLDARASPPEKIVWTLENVRAMDKNDAENAYDCQVTAREILGGEFGEFIDPNELSSDTGLVPLAIVTDPTVTGIGDQTIYVEMVEALLKSKDDLYPYQAKGHDLYKLNYLSNYFEPNSGNFGAIADVATSHGAQTLIEKGPRDFLLKNDNHLLVFGGRLPEIMDCTLVKMKFRALGVDFNLEADATSKLSHLKLSFGSNTFTLVPFTPYYLKAVAKDPLHSTSNRRKDVNFPESMDCIFILAPDKKDRKFTAKNLDKFAIVLAFIGGLPL